MPPVFRVRALSAISNLVIASVSSGCSPILARRALSRSWAPSTCSTAGGWLVLGGVGSADISLSLFHSQYKPKNTVILGEESGARSLFECPQPLLEEFPGWHK